MKFAQVLNILGLIIVMIGAAMIPSWGIAVFYKESYQWSWLGLIVLTSLLGFICYFRTPKQHEIGYKEGLCIVGLSWLILAGVGAFPYLFSQALTHYIDAFFESMSGFSTTGATVITDIEALPRSILFWRSFTHWIGGMGVIVLSISILPLLGAGGSQLFRVETTGPSTDKLTPKIGATASILWKVYILFTLVQVTLLYWGDMPIFDAFCHTFGTIATGGFSTKTMSIGYYNSWYVEMITIVFMVIGGVNFSLHYRFLRGDIKSYWKNSECRFFIGFLLGASALVIWDISIHFYGDWVQGFRHGLFQTVTIMTTTGFGTADFDQWPSFSKFILFVLMLVGGSAGSTAGGMKCMRILLLIKYGMREIRRLVFPRAVFPIKVDGVAVDKKTVQNALGFMIISFIVFMTATLVMTISGLDLISAISSVVASLWSIGPGFGLVGPSQNYAEVSALGKFILSLCMVMGRLEFYTIIVLFSPALWKK